MHGIFSRASAGLLPPSVPTRTTTLAAAGICSGHRFVCSDPRRMRRRGRSCPMQRTPVGSAAAGSATPGVASTSRRSIRDCARAAANANGSHSAKCYGCGVGGLHGRASALHSRQWLGCTSTQRLVSALIQPPGTRRHANATACSSSPLSTASCKSRSNGADAIGCHIAHEIACGAAARADLHQPAVQLDALRT